MAHKKWFINLALAFVFVMGVQIGAARGEELNGLYRSFSLIRVTLYGGKVPRAILFSKEGHFCSIWPDPKSLPDFDFDHARKMYPSKCGTYTIQDGSIHFQFADGTQKTSYFKRKPHKESTSVEFEGTSWVAVAPWEVKQIDGTYESNLIHFGFDNDQCAWPKFSRGEGIVIQFSKDGHVSISKSTENKTLAGTYRLDGAVLTLNFSDNSSCDCDLYVTKTDQKNAETSLIFINGRPFLTP
jgi:hypothetical protein